MAARKEREGRENEEKECKKGNECNEDHCKGYLLNNEVSWMSRIAQLGP